MNETRQKPQRKPREPPQNRKDKLACAMCLSLFLCLSVSFLSLPSSHGRQRRQRRQRRQATKRRQRKQQRQNKEETVCLLCRCLLCIDCLWFVSLSLSGCLFAEETTRNQRKDRETERKDTERQAETRGTS